jgi:hypothetical protein
MKLKLHTAIALISIACFASCSGNDNNSYVDKSIMPTPEEKAASEKAAAQKAALNATIPGNNAMPANMQQNMQQVQQPVAGQPGSTIKMPDGKMVTIPGGGPISITPAAGQPNATPQNNVVMTPVPTVTQPGMNPPHGQPNHRCDIAVGAPLNSKPAAPATTTGTTVNAQPQVTMKEIANTTKTAPGMNPPHGEPGHRCDIAVGAPLNSKPAPTTVTTTSTPATIAPPPLLTAPKADSTKN